MTGKCIPVAVPNVGTGDDAIRITAWLVDQGDQVFRNEQLLELMVPGVTFDVPSPVEGRLMTLARPVGALVSPGETVGWILPMVAGRRSVAS